MAAVGCARASASTPFSDADGGADTGFAVVELFTSEGCSSCPPADDVLRDVAAQAMRSGRHVYPLAFHVDYWNSLGWPDPYSSGLATDRQHAYARALGEQGVYTPEMIVNGRDAFVGSDASRAHRSIDAALRGREIARIELKTKVIDDAVTVDYTVTNAPKGHLLELALVQNAAETHVRAGENAGRTLRHADVVRSFRTVELDVARTGHVAFAPARAPASRASIVAFVQSPETMAIVGAARADL
jgi:hypothetical protein